MDTTEEQEERGRLVGAIPEGGWAFVIDRWYVRPPGTRRAASVENHTITDHGDGTITVHPSVEYSAPHRGDYYHGWLEHGVWRPA